MPSWVAIGRLAVASKLPSNPMRLLTAILVILLLPACQSSEEKGQALLAAAEAGQAVNTANLLEAGAVVDSRDECRFTPLMKAALNGHSQTVERLLLFGADLEAADKSGYTALLLATGNDHVEVVQRLLAAGADPNHIEHSNGWTALIIAARVGDLALLELLLEAGADPASRDTAGLNALHWAARMNHEEAAERLVKAIRG